MVFSLNRGMFLSLGIGILYVTLRLAQRGRFVALGSLLGLAALVAVVLVTTPLGHLMAASFSSTHGHSNSTRLSASQLALEGARQSPIFGYGEPQEITGQSYQPPIGTQGQLWTVLYSNGIPAAVFFIGFFVVVLWQTRKARGISGLWLHTVRLSPSRRSSPRLAAGRIAGRHGCLRARLPLLPGTNPGALPPCSRACRNSPAFALLAKVSPRWAMRVEFPRSTKRPASGRA